MEYQEYIIGMTLVPECQLAREAQICYVSISTVTDYDVWAEKPVTAKEVLETLSKNVEKTKEERRQPFCQLLYCIFIGPRSPGPIYVPGSLKQTD